MELLSHYIEYQSKTHTEKENWKNNIIGEGISYSHRDTEYDRITYPSNLHYHDYYEVVIFEGGEVSYLSEGRVYYPKRGDIIIIPPRKFHMSVINSEKTRYIRHVFYLYPFAFDKIGHGILTDFLKKVTAGELFVFNNLEDEQKFFEVLKSLSEVFDKELSHLENALGLSFVIQAFYLLNKETLVSKNEKVLLPKNIMALKEYVDRNFDSISSVTEVSNHFFYSREYVSRLFRKYFDTTISDYIMKKRISKSQELIVKEGSIIDVAYQVGFGSLSTFIRAFKSVTGITPSEYRKLSKKS